MAQCYFCGKEAVTKEHVPPKSMFPSDMRNNLIKVPSCKEHNNEKSGDDEYFRYIVMGQSDFIMSDGRFKNLLTKLLRSVKRKPALSIEILGTRKPIGVGYTGELVENTVKINEVRLNDSLEAISKGIYYFEYGQQFLGVPNIYALNAVFTDDMDTEILYFENQKAVNKNILNRFVEIHFKGDNQLVFKYRLLEQDQGILMHLRFYSQIDYVIGLGVSVTKS